MCVCVYSEVCSGKTLQRGEIIPLLKETKRRVTLGRGVYLKAPQGPSVSFPQYHWMKVQSLENLREERDFDLAPRVKKREREGAKQQL